MFFGFYNTTLLLLGRLSLSIGGKVEDLLALLLIAEAKSRILEGILGGHLFHLQFEGVHLQQEGLLALGEELQFTPDRASMEVSILAKQTKKDKIC